MGLSACIFANSAWEGINSPKSPPRRLPLRMNFEFGKDEKYRVPSFLQIYCGRAENKKNKQKKQTKKTTLHFYFQKAFLTRLMGLSPCNLVNAGCEGINSLKFSPRRLQARANFAFD